MRRGLAAGALLLAVAALAGCGNPEEDLEESRQALRSWTATVEELSRGWTRSLLPAAYVKTALEASDEEVLKESRKLEKTAKRLPRAGEAIGRAAALRERIARLREAVARHDRAAGKPSGAEASRP